MVHLMIVCHTWIIKIKDNAEQSRSAFAFSKKVDDETVQKFNDGLKKIEENGELAKIGKKWFGQDVSKSK